MEKRKLNFLRERTPIIDLTFTSFCVFLQEIQRKYFHAICQRTLNDDKNNRLDNNQFALLGRIIRNVRVQDALNISPPPSSLLNQKVNFFIYPSTKSQFINERNFHVECQGRERGKEEKSQL